MYTIYAATCIYYLSKCPNVAYLEGRSKSNKYGSSLSRSVYTDTL